MKHIIQIICEQNDINVRSYSGRGMYGKECLGITFKRGMGFVNVVDAMLEYIQNNEEYYIEIESFREGIRDMQSDSMGLGTVVYFPSVEYDDSDNTSTDE